MTKKPLYCVVCGSEIEPNPRRIRGLCWVCNRLAASVAAEARQMAKEFQEEAV